MSHPNLANFKSLALAVTFFCHWRRFSCQLLCRRGHRQGFAMILPFSFPSFQVVQEAVHEAVNEAVHDAVVQAIEENVNFDVRANIYTLVAVTGGWQEGLAGWCAFTCWLRFLCLCGALVCSRKYLCRQCGRRVHLVFSHISSCMVVCQLSPGSCHLCKRECCRGGSPFMCCAGSRVSLLAVQHILPCMCIASAGACGTAYIAC